MKKLLLFYCVYLLSSHALFSQTVGIGTTTPNAKAALEIKTTDKGILFPRLTSAQRNAIVNPPDGLHLYNIDERCLNFYDSLFQVWNCYCEADTCKVVTIHITADATNINFNTSYATLYPGKTKFVILVYPGVTINSVGAAAIDFSTIPGNAKITIINRGNILGNGGGGGSGATGHVGGPCNRPANPGSPGGHAIMTKVGVPVTINNYGTVAGGGGGGGGGGRNVIGEYGGGGGGGAGPSSGGGTGGGTTFSTGCFPVCGCATITVIAQSGQPGTLTAGGAGGLGANGAGAGNGGAGGVRAQVGQNGTGTAAGTGGAPGKAIYSPFGSSGSIINNLAGGLTFGVVD